VASSEQTKLADTGIVGTPVHYCFSYEVATWLEGRARGSVSIDWREHDPSSLDEILTHLLQPSPRRDPDAPVATIRRRVFRWRAGQWQGVDRTRFSKQQRNRFRLVAGAAEGKSFRIDLGRAL
jgi:hypothetical protein